MFAYIVIGIVTGSLYGLTATGLVLTYRTSGVFNFGHGAIAAAAAYVFYSLHYTHGIDWPIAGLLTVGSFAAIGGWVMERITRGLSGLPEAISVVATVGIMLGIDGALFLQFGSELRSFPDFLPDHGFHLGGVEITWSEVISTAIAVVCVAGLYLFLRVSRLGVAMRAVVDNPTLTALGGDAPARIRLASWMIGVGFAAMSGILLAPTLGLDATLLTLLVVQAFGACAVGLFKSLPATYLGGIVVGVAAALATKTFDSGALQGLPTAVPFIVLFAVLIVVPTNRLPRRRVSGGSLIPEVAPMSARNATALTVAGTGALIVVPHVVGAHLPLWTNALISVLLFVSLALLVWVSGQISLCHAPFIALGATNMSHLQDHGVPWGVAVLLAGLLTVPVGVLIALPAIRLSGLYLALATLGFGVFMQNVMYNTKWMFGSGAGRAEATRPTLGSFDANDPDSFYYLVLAIAIVGLLGMAVIYRSRLGRILRSMSESPTMLTTNGLNVSMARVVVFGISAFYAAVAGALTVTQFGSASGQGYGPVQSLIYLAVLAICGTRLLRSSLLAAGLLILVPGYIDGFGQEKQLLGFGLVAVATSIFIAKRPAMMAWIAQEAAARKERTVEARAIADQLSARAISVGYDSADRESSGRHAVLAGSRNGRS
jgi:branched-subunit amino acid ABC-type transport system permease component